MIKKYNQFIKENVEVEPVVKPKTTPRRSPNRPSPIRRDKPSVTPKPKASDKELAEKFLSLVKNDKTTLNMLKNKYSK
jgi:hypothetical protein